MSKSPSSPVFIPDDLIPQILPSLPVKSLLRFKCVSNSWNTLISDPTFEKIHLMKSKTSPNPQFTLISNHVKPSVDSDWSIIPYPVSRLIDNPSDTFVADSYYLLNLKDKEWSMAGSCNGLICLVGYNSISSKFFSNRDIIYQDYCLRLWNPSTRKISQKIGYFRDSRGFVFNFGWDDSTCTFKVVASRYIHNSYMKRVVKVLTIGDNVWRNIHYFPVVPLGLGWRGQHLDKGYEYGCVFLHTSFNWLAIRKQVRFNWSYYVNDITVEDIVIVSLDLRTETYNQYRLPQGFDELPPEEPTIAVLKGCLCLCCSYKETGIVIWQMNKFGVEQSWIQFLNISNHIVGLDHNISFLPLFLSKDGDTLVLCSSQNEVAILYNLRDNSMQRIEVKVHKTIIDDKTHNSLYLSLAQGYVESLISIC